MPHRSLRTLAQLPLNERAVIDRVDDEALATQLLEVGLLPGQEVEVLRRGPLGSPLYLRTGKNYLAIRPQEAERVLLHPWLPQEAKP